MLKLVASNLSSNKNIITSYHMHVLNLSHLGGIECPAPEGKRDSFAMRYIQFL